MLNYQLNEMVRLGLFNMLKTKPNNWKEEIHISYIQAKVASTTSSQVYHFRFTKCFIRDMK